MKIERKKGKLDVHVKLKRQEAEWLECIMYFTKIYQRTDHNGYSNVPKYRRLSFRATAKT